MTGSKPEDDESVQSEWTLFNGAAAGLNRYARSSGEENYGVRAMLLHPIEPEILLSGAVIFTPMELTVIALARSEKGQTLGSRSRLAQALFKVEQFLPGQHANGSLADPRLEALRAFVNTPHRRGQGLAAATQSLREAGFSSMQENWLCSECAEPL